jgi:hypothetical protein
LRNTIISSIRQGIRNAIESVVSSLGPMFYWPGTHTLEATTGADPTFTRTTAATVKDFEGVIRTVETSEPRFQGARRVENLFQNSENLEASTWLQSAQGAGSAPVFVSGKTYTFECGGTGGADRSRFMQTMPLSASQSSVVSIDLSANTNVDIVLILGGGAGLTVSLTSEVKRFYYFSDVNVINPTFEIRAAGSVSGAAPFQVTIGRPQFEDVTGQTNQNPSEYVSTGVATGPELVVNGDFATDSDWTLVNGTITGGQFVGGASGTQGVQQTSTDIREGNTYQVTFDATVAVGTATLYLRLGSGNNVGSWNVGVTPTTFTGTFAAAGASGLIYILIANGNSLHLDNISIKAAEHGANVDGVQYFNTLNANTVTGNVVTEAVGSPLTRANTQFGDLHGVASDYFSTPNTTDNTIAGDVDVRAKIACNSYVGSDQTIVTKRTGSDRGEYTLRVSSSSARNLQFYWGNSTTFVVFQQTMIANPLVDGRIAYVRATRGVNGANYEVKFYSSVDGVAWVQEGSTQTVPTAGNTPVSGNTPLGVGALSAGQEKLVGRIYNVQVYNGINGTLAAEFNAGDYVSGSTLVSSTSGETWTLQGNASVFQPPVNASGPFGYLTEKANANLAIQSEDFTTSWTVASTVTVTANAAVAPDGTTTGDKIFAATSTAGHAVYQNISTSWPRGTVSVYAKPAGYNYLRIIELGNFSYKGNFLLTGEGSAFDGQGANFVSSSITAVGNGWYRCSITTNRANAGAPSLIGYPDAAAVPNLAAPANYAGDGVSGVYVWGAQVEAGTYPTSYIATTTTAVTRNVDYLDSSVVVPDAAGAVYAEVSSNWNVQPGTSMMVLKRGDSSTGKLMGSDSTFIKTFSNGSGLSSSPTGTSYYNAPQDLAATWGDSGLIAYFNGAPDATPATYGGTFGAGDLYIGHGRIGQTNWDGTIREVKIFNSELTAAEIGDL